MTISESIMNWLKLFEREGLKGIEEITTDSLGPSADSYGLRKTKKTVVKKYLGGKEEHTEYYRFLARFDNRTEEARIVNGTWLEALCDWIADRNEAKEFPELGNRSSCTYIGVSTSFCMSMEEPETAVYMMTIAIKYVKEK